MVGREDTASSLLSRYGHTAFHTTDARFEDGGQCMRTYTGEAAQRRHGGEYILGHEELAPPAATLGAASDTL
ncbi:hypothetical protein EON66_05175 [archaeon]|nr:MAG: hypothetical protein EON66_05175 [archaeon]